VDKREGCYGVWKRKGKTYRGETRAIVPSAKGGGVKETRMKGDHTHLEGRSLRRSVQGPTPEEEKKNLQKKRKIEEGPQDGQGKPKKI